MPYQIAIDGPVAAGKGTVAKLVALRLNFLYVDTGAMYRASAYLADLNHVSWDKPKEIAALIEKSSMILRNPLETEKDGRQVTVILNDEDVSWKIRTEHMSTGSSVVSQYTEVRKELVKKQQELAKKTSVVMEGRDITFRVLPNAQIKIYLDASAETRAKRRFQELLMRGVDTTYEDVYDDLLERDARDMGREVDPLHIVEGDWILDTTSLTIEEVVDLIVAKFHTISSGK